MGGIFFTSKKKSDAKILGDYYNRRCKTNPEVEDLFKRYKQE